MIDAGRKEWGHDTQQHTTTSTVTMRPVPIAPVPHPQYPRFLGFPGPHPRLYCESVQREEGSVAVYESRVYVLRRGE